MSQFEHYPNWTNSQFFSFIRSALRSASNRYPVKYEVKNASRRKYNGGNKRQSWEYQCNKCRNWYSAKEVSVDHIVPVGSLNSFDDLPMFCKKLFCGKEGLQVLCNLCHSEKSGMDKTRMKMEQLIRKMTAEQVVEIILSEFTTEELQEALNAYKSR